MLDKGWPKDLCTMESMVSEIDDYLKNGETGTLIITDICRFEEICSKHGHLSADRLLQRFAWSLQNIEETLDAVGHIGPSAFALFFCSNREFERVGRIKDWIEEGLKRAARAEDIGEDIEAVTIAVTGEAGESSNKIMSRAHLLLTSEKRRLRREAFPFSQECVCNKKDKSVIRDMELINAELMEKERTRGAYLQNYETFKIIYRFVARGLERTKDSAYILLLTLDGNEAGRRASLEEQEEMMELLYQVIKHELRRGDAFTQYSSCQYLLMVLSTSGENAVKIGERVKKSFESVIMYQYELNLCYDVYPMKAPVIDEKGLPHE